MNQYTPTYHSTIRKYIIAFGRMFNDLAYYSARDEKHRIVPINYIDKERFRSLYKQSISSEGVSMTLPIMGFRLAGMNPDLSRNKAKLHLTSPCTGDTILSSTPYTFNFELDIMSRNIDTMLRIIEQIFPYFDPSVKLQINDNNMNMVNHVDVVLKSNTPMISLNDGDMHETRTVRWGFKFELRGDMYQHVEEDGGDIIKSVEVSYGDLDTGEFGEFDYHYVEPFNANENDPHTIKTQNNNNPLINLSIETGSESTTEL